MVKAPGAYQRHRRVPGTSRSVWVVSGGLKANTLAHDGSRLERDPVGEASMEVPYRAGLFRRSRERSTVGGFLRCWLRDVVAVSLRPTTKASYPTLVTGSPIPPLGRCPL